MKIDNNIKPVGLPPSGVPSSNRAASSKPGEKNMDRAVLSDGAQIMAKAMESLKDTPEVRESRLEELRNQIVNGQYQVPYEELAKKLSLKSWLG